MRSLSSLGLLMLGMGCAIPDLGSLSESDAATVLAAAKRELGKVHEIALLGAPYPQVYEYGCSSGTIDMRISIDEMMQPVALRHRMDGCMTADGIAFSGGLNYVNIEPGCADESGLAFSIGGLVEVEGAMDGFCYIETKENCGRLSSGHVCGYMATDITIAQ